MTSPGRIARRTNAMPGLLVGLALALAQTASAAESQTEEYDMKAVFLLNFSQFVSWPAGAFSSPQAPLVIGVLGEDPVGEELDDIARGKRVQGHPVTVQHYARVEDVRDCHILFIGSSQEAQIARVMAALKGRNVLTVGDYETFLRDGGVIRLVKLGDQLKMHINLDAAKSSHLDISSKLLRPAYVVTSDTD
jgi:YfiR/HmsC-like